MNRVHKRSERGQALILIVFGIVALLGVTALAVDGGNAYADRRKAQNAADAAALAAALGRVNGENWLATTYAVARENGYNNDGTSNVVEVHSPPISGTYEGNLEYIQVRITSNLRTYFASVVGMSTIQNVVETISRSKPAEWRPMFDGAAVVSLAPVSDCGDNKAFWVHAESTLDISSAGIFVNSNNRDCALIQQASGSIRLQQGQTIRVVGGWHIDKPQLLTPFPPIQVPPVSYPPPFYMPKPGCAGREALISADGSTMSPGSFGDVFPPPGVTNLQSGTYCLSNDFVMGTGQSLQGGGVLIYMESGQMKIQGGAQLNLNPPQKGPYAGLLVYQPQENHNMMVLNAAVGSAIIGTFLVPGAGIRFKGNDSRAGFHSQFVGLWIDADGNSNIVINYVQDRNYLALYQPEVQLIK